MIELASQQQQTPQQPAAQAQVAWQHAAQAGYHLNPSPTQPQQQDSPHGGEMPEARYHMDHHHQLAQHQEFQGQVMAQLAAQHHHGNEHLMAHSIYAQQNNGVQQGRGSPQQGDERSPGGSNGGKTPEVRVKRPMNAFMVCFIYTFLINVFFRNKFINNARYFI